jgi:nicotinamidase-related amidase
LLIEAARKLNTNIIFSYRNTSTKYESLARLYTFAKLLDSQQRSMPPPEKGIPSITINGSENKPLTTKLTTSIFIGTDSKRMIRNAESTTIIFTGITTKWHETSTRDVLNEDFLSNYNLRCGITIR